MGLPELKYENVEPSFEIIHPPFSDGTTEIIKRIIIEILYKHQGYDHRIIRGTLLFRICMSWQHDYSSILFLSDRKMRDIIEDLRCTDVLGSRICSTSGNKGGYFVATRRRELLANLMSDLRQALTILRRFNAQRRNSIKAFAVNSFEELTQISLFEQIDA
jgi:hypothetical protein